MEPKQPKLQQEKSLQSPPIPFSKSFILTIIALFLTLSGVLTFRNLKLKQQLTQLQPQPTPIQAPTGDLAKWKTYRNKVFNFELKYPSDLSYAAAGTDYGLAGYITFRRGNEEIFIVNVSENFAPEGYGNFMGGKAKGKQTIGRQDWNYYNFYYKDKEFENLQYYLIAFEVIKDEALFVIEFKGKQKLTDEQTQILSTFKFLE